MKRKAAAWAAVLAIMLALLPAAKAADAVFTVTPPQGGARAGETFTVTVALTGDPGFCVAQFTLSYDRTKMTCVGADAGPLLANTVFAINPEAEPGVIAAAASTDAVTGDGVLLSARFRANADLESFGLGLTGVKLKAADGGDIPFTVRGTQAQPAPQPFIPSQPTTPTEPNKPDDPEEPGSTPEPVPAAYPDVAGHWGAEWIAKASARGLFNGWEDGLFHPDENITRADFVLVLWRLANTPAPHGDAPFTDVPAWAYYAKAVAWAAEQGIVAGKGGGKFDPTGALTRQEAMKILFGYSGGVSGEESLLTAVYDASFTDSGDIAPWAKAAMYWGVYHKLISGPGDGTILPTGTATRAQLAKILVVYLEGDSVACTMVFAMGGDTRQSLSGFYLDGEIPSGIGVQMQNGSRRDVSGTVLADVRNNGNFVPVYNGSVRMRVTVADAAAGKRYAAVLVSGHVDALSVPNIDNAIAFIDSQNGADTVFDVYPMPFTAVTELTLFIVGDGGERYVVNCGYAPEDTYDIRTYTPGDADGDGDVDIEDAMAILRHYTRLALLTGKRLAAADVKNDGTVDAEDALEILRFLAHLPSRLG